MSSVADRLRKAGVEVEESRPGHHHLFFFAPNTQRALRHATEEPPATSQPSIEKLRD